MKIRSGFVSNSSSSSFVMVGIDTEGIGVETLKLKLLEKCNFKLPDYAESAEDVSIGEITNDELSDADDGKYFGVKMYTGDDVGEIDFDTLKEKEKALSNILYALGYPNAKIILIAGTEYN